jgi:hypothetical protein
VDDVNELRQELRKLQRKIDRIENRPARRAESELAELIGNNDETPTQRRGFAAACAESKADLAAQQLRAARRQLESNGLPQDQQAFRRAYSAIPGDQLSELFREFE